MRRTLIPALLLMLPLMACAANTRTIPVPAPQKLAPGGALTRETPAPPLPAADAGPRDKARWLPACREALAACNADKAEIRSLYQTKGDTP